MDEAGNRNGGGTAVSLARGRARLREFSRSLPMSLLKAREAVMGHFRPGLHHFGITEQQWRVLRALTSVESIEVMALAKATFLLAPSLSRILKDLEERGLIHRRTPENDMRRGLISISRQGRELIDKAGSHSEAIYAEITRRYGTEKLTRLQEMLRELEQVLAEPIDLGDLPLRPQEPSSSLRRLSKATGEE
ncbi:MAG: homoprotocatechuate degradation operon regulator HpaR [Rhizobiaceae bacterium]|nr:homoprotocatechuate degradation operon regulator HpaR [Rhizobiaceae bacterium]MCV0407533.1 homoprotocatechuate degradation operon regulator HpaR [Rhizobiaceae bacterium]